MGSQIEIFWNECLFVLLTSLKNGGKWDLMGEMFRIKEPMLQRLMKSFLLFVSPVVYERQVPDRAGFLTMKVL